MSFKTQIFDSINAAKKKEVLQELVHESIQSELNKIQQRIYDKLIKSTISERDIHTNPVILKDLLNFPALICRTLGNHQDKGENSNRKLDNITQAYISISS